MGYAVYRFGFNYANSEPSKPSYILRAIACSYSAVRPPKLRSSYYQKNPIKTASWKNLSRTIQNMIKTQSLGTRIGVNLMKSRAKEIEPFIPREYQEELNGLSAGSGIDYEMLLMLNVLDTIGRHFGCTSVAVRGEDGKLLRSRNLDYKDYAIFKPDTLEFWIAIDPPPATRGRWVGFCLSRELYGKGPEPEPQVFPALD